MSVWFLESQTKQKSVITSEVASQSKTDKKSSKISTDDKITTTKANEIKKDNTKSSMFTLNNS